MPRQGSKALVRAVVLCIVFAAADLSPAPCATGAAPRPNVILIVTDDQRWDSLGPIHSPSGTNVMPSVVTQLAATGVRFTNAYTTTPICAPSRASILTGRYAHNHLVRGNLPPVGGAQAFNDTSTLATSLMASGYRTGLFGKYLNDYDKLWSGTQAPYLPPGWNEWRAFKVPEYFNYVLVENGVETPFGSAPTEYSTDIIRAKAINFITSSAGLGQPFFVYFAPYSPHKPYTPAPRHAGMFSGVAPWRPPNFNEADVSDKPQWLRNMSGLTQTSAAQIDRDRKGYLESLQAVDEAVKAILQALNTLNISQTTMVIYVGDHSYSWGEHRVDGKGTGYEENVRIPLVIRYPALAPAARVESRVALNVDLPATILSLAGATPPLPPDGTSLEPLISGAQVPWRSDFLTEGWDAEAVPTEPYWASVHQGNWVYTEYRTGETELYDLSSDPYELANAAASPANEGIRANLAARLRFYRPGWPADIGCIDADADGYAPGTSTQCRTPVSDCNDVDASVWTPPGEAGVYLDLPPPGKATIFWAPPATIGTTSPLVKYDTIRSTMAGDFSNAVCIESNNGPNTVAQDPAVPAVNKAWFYLVRARNACPGGVGTWGTTSNGTIRSSPACP